MMMPRALGNVRVMVVFARHAFIFAFCLFEWHGRQ
jgi:hypothetical protein